MMKRILLVLAALVFASPSHATNSTVSAMTAASALGGTELLYVVQGGADRKGTPAQLAAYMEGLITGDCTINTGTSVITCTKTNGVAFGTAATQNTGTSGATIPLLSTANTWTLGQTFSAAPTFGSITGSTQCLHVNSSGVLSGTGSDCGAGGGSGVTQVNAGVGVQVTNPTGPTVTVSAAVVQRVNTLTSDTLVASDAGNVVTENNASPVAVSIAQAGTTGFASGQYWTLKNEGAGLVTLKTTTSTIDGIAGATGITLKQNQSVDFYSDGANYWTLPGKPTNVACGDLTDSSTGCQATTGTSGHTIPFLDGTNTFSGVQTFNANDLALAGVTGSTQCLHANSSGVVTGTGSDCGAGGGGAANHPGYKASIWYLGLDQVQRTGGSGINLTTAYCSIMHIGGTSSATLQALGTNINGAVAATHIQLAIYNNDFTSGVARPGTLIDSTPSISSATAGPVSANLNATHSVAAGFYWSCVQADNNTVSTMANSGGVNGQTEMILVGDSTINNTLANNFPDSVSTTTGISSFGTWPATMVGATFADAFNHSVWIGFQFASVP